MIAMTARTGSTHLCAAMEEAGDTGPIGEIFNPRGPVGEAKSRHQVSLFADYLRAIYAIPGDLLAFKTAWVDFAPLAGGYKSLFPRLQVIYLNRKDEIAQAVSLYRALITNHWHRRPGVPPPANSELPFDLDHICRLLKVLQEEKYQWEAFFLGNGLQPTRLIYESFVSDVRVALNSITVHTGIPLYRDVSINQGYEIVSDFISKDWINRVRRHLWNMT